ncbi:hypothetical protein V5799_013600 [Amblyomma americanum]|uniref:Uncharacterized protein n=1 Tax=Amblyomma americanum TaxID=6943 RepID=A0AAQ4E5K6_AMBAM
MPDVKGGDLKLHSLDSPFVKLYLSSVEAIRSGQQSLPATRSSRPTRGLNNTAGLLTLRNAPARYDDVALDEGAFVPTSAFFEPFLALDNDPFTLGAFGHFLSRGSPPGPPWTRIKYICNKPKLDGKRTREEEGERDKRGIFRGTQTAGKPVPGYRALRLLVTQSVSVSLFGVAWARRGCCRRRLGCKRDLRILLAAPRRKAVARVKSRLSVECARGQPRIGRERTVQEGEDRALISSVALLASLARRLRDRPSSGSASLPFERITRRPLRMELRSVT